MTGNNILLDTTIVIELFKGNKIFASQVSQYENVFITITVLGELYVGINRVANQPKHLKLLQEFIKNTTVIAADTETAVQYGKIMASLYKKGKPIPTNDIWIGAIGLQYNLPIASKDKHFKEIDSLKLLLWQS
jgi:tRNA(fMet)-specific endonuclease VapC